MGGSLDLPGQVEAGDWAALLARAAWGAVYHCILHIFLVLFFKSKKLNPFYDPKLSKVRWFFSRA